MSIPAPLSLHHFKICRVHIFGRLHSCKVYRTAQQVVVLRGIKFKVVDPSLNLHFKNISLKTSLLEASRSHRGHSKILFARMTSEFFYSSAECFAQNPADYSRDYLHVHHHFRLNTEPLLWFSLGLVSSRVRFSTARMVCLCLISRLVDTR